MKQPAATQPKDIRMDVQFRNNLILAKMTAAGLKTVAELSRATNVPHCILGRLINMKELPQTQNGNRKWREPVLRLANFFKCLPEDLFSEFQQENVLEENRAHIEVHFGAIQAMLATQRARLLDPETVVQTREMHKILYQRIATLKPRQQKVLRARFGIDGPEMTLGETGEILGISGERARQLERKALRELRHPRNSNPIRAAGGNDI